VELLLALSRYQAMSLSPEQKNALTDDRLKAVTMAMEGFTDDNQDVDGGNNTTGTGTGAGMGGVGVEEGRRVGGKWREDSWVGGGRRGEIGGKRRKGGWEEKKVLRWYGARDEGWWVMKG
jgi:hypothetical protein